MTIENEQMNIEYLNQYLSNIDSKYQYAPPELREKAKRDVQELIDIYQQRAQRKQNIANRVINEQQKLESDYQAKRYNEQSEKNPVEYGLSAMHSAGLKVGTGALKGISEIGLGIPGWLARTVSGDEGNTGAIGRDLMQYNRDFKNYLDNFVAQGTGFDSNEIGSLESQTKGREWLGGVVRAGEGLAEMELPMAGVSALSGVVKASPAVKTGLEGLMLGIQNIPSHSDYIEQTSGKFKPLESAATGIASGELMSYAFYFGRTHGMSERAAMNFAKDVASKGLGTTIGEGFKQGLKTAFLNAGMNGLLGTGLKESAALPEDATEEERKRMWSNIADSMEHEFIMGLGFGFHGGVKETMQAKQRYREMVKAGKDMMYPEKTPIKEKTLLQKSWENTKNTFKDFFTGTTRDDNAFDRGVSKYFLELEGRNKLTDKETLNKLFEGPETNIDEFIQSIKNNVPKEFRSNPAVFDEALNAYKDSLILERNYAVIDRYAKANKKDVNKLIGLYDNKLIDVDSNGKLVFDAMKQVNRRLKEALEINKKQQGELDKAIQDKNTPLTEQQNLAQQNEELRIKGKEISARISKPYSVYDMVGFIRNALEKQYGQMPEFMKRVDDVLSKYMSDNWQTPISADEAMGVYNQIAGELSKLDTRNVYDDYNTKINNIVNFGQPTVYGQDNRPSSVIENQRQEPLRLGYDNVVYGNDERNIPTSALPNNTQPQSVLPSPQETPLLEYNPTGRRQMPISEGSNQPINNMDIGSKVNRESPSNFGVVNNVPRSVNMLGKPNKSNMSEKSTGSKKENVKPITNEKIIWLYDEYKNMYENEPQSDKEIDGSFDNYLNNLTKFQADKIRKAEEAGNAQEKAQWENALKNTQEVIKYNKEQKANNVNTTEKGELKGRDMPMSVSQPSNEPMAVKKEFAKKPNAEELGLTTKRDALIPKQNKKSATEKYSATQNAVLGKRTKMTTKANGGMEVDGTFGVVDVNDLETSTSIGETQNRNRNTIASQAQINSIANNPNPDYLLVDNADSANGAMVVMWNPKTKKYRVLSGNGRTLGLTEAYKYGKADNYQKELNDKASSFDIDKESIGKIKNPVLVRIIEPKDGFDVKRFVKESNESQQLGRNAAEIARTDAENIKDILRFFNGTKELNSESNSEFIRKFFEKTVGDTERANYLANDGSLTPDGERRITNALIASLYGNNPRLIERLSNTTNEGVKKIANALIQSANDSSKLRGEIQQGKFWNVDLGKDISDAALAYMDTVGEMNRQKAKGSVLSFYLKNMKDRLSPDGKVILGMFSELKSAQRIKDFINIMNGVVRGKGDPNQGLLFGESGKKPTNGEIIREALQEFDSQFKTDFSKKDLSSWNMADKTLFDLSVNEDGIPASVKKERFTPDYSKKRVSEWTKQDWEDWDSEQIRIADEVLGKEGEDTAPIKNTEKIKQPKQQQNMYKALKSFLPDIFEKYDRESESPAPVQALRNILRGGEALADIEYAINRGDPREAIDIIREIKQRAELTYSKEFSAKIAKNCDRLVKMIKNSNYRDKAIKLISLEELEAQPINRMPQEDVEAWREQRKAYVGDKKLTELSKFLKKVYAADSKEIADWYKSGKITDEQRKLWNKVIKAEYDYNLDVDFNSLTKEEKETFLRAYDNFQNKVADLNRKIENNEITFEQFVDRRHQAAIDYHTSLARDGIQTNATRRMIIDPNRNKPQLSRTKNKATNPVSDKDLNNFLKGQAKQITKETGLNFKVVNSVDELRKMFPNNDITDTVEGGIHKDTVYLVKGNIDKNRLPLVIAHEVAGHRGVESLFENKQQMDNFFKSLERASVKDKFIRDAFAEVDRLGYKENRSREAMAKIVEKVRNESGTLKGTAKTFVNFITSRVRRFLRKLGFKNLQLNEAEVYDLAVQALRRTGLKNSNKFFGLDRFLAKDNSFLSATSTELDKKYPGWQNQTNNNGGHTTQIKATVNTYRKIGEWIKNNMKGAKILDASSGLGEGTEALKQMGLNIEDVEPYASKKRKNAPIYDSYDKIKGKYDAIISNAVLNVIPDNWRSELLHNMADKLNDGGKLFINVRDAIEVSKQKQKVELDSPSEILVTNGKGGYRAYQKGFTQPELESWVKKELGNGYKVEKANEKNSGMPSGSRAVVITKEGGNGGKRTNPRYEEITKQLNSSQLKNRMSNDSAKPLTPLKTLQGTPIKRYGNLVGKRVGGKDSAGGQIYVHKNYANEIIPNEILNKVKKILAEKNPDFKYNAIMWDRDKGTIRFDEAPNFDTAPEPIPGKILTINPSTGEIKEAYSDRIWHHKWMWVKDDYKGFDTKESWERSREWLNGLANLGLDKNHSDYSLSHNGIANGSASGYDAWNKQLKYYGLDHLIDNKNNTVPKADIQFSIGARKSPIEDVAGKASDEMNTYSRKRNAKEAKKVLDKNFDYYEKLKKGTFKNKKLTDYKASALKASYLTGYDTKEKETMERFKAIGDFNKTREAVREYIDKTIPSDKRAKLLDSLMKQKTTEGIMDIAGKASIEKERAIRNSELEILKQNLKDLKANKISTEHSMLKLDALSETLTQEELDGLLNSNDFSTGAVKKMYKLLRTAKESLKVIESDEAGNLKVPDKIKALASELDSTFRDSLLGDDSSPSMKVSVETLAKLNHILKDIKDQSRIAKINLAKDATNEAYMAKEKIVGEMKPVNEAVANSRETNRTGLYNTHLKPISAMNTLDLDNFTSEMGETMNKVAYKDMLEGQKRKEHFLARGYKEVDNIIESFGKNKEDGLENLGKTFTTVETSDKHKYDITRDEAMAIYAMSTDRETRKIIKADGGLTLYLGDKKGSDSFTLSIEKLNEIANNLTAKEKEAVMRVKKSLAWDYLPELNAVHEKLNGVPLRLLVDGTYFPRTYMEDADVSKGNGVLDGLSAPYVSDTANAEWASLLKHRGDGAKFRLRGLTKTYENYVDQASNYIGMAEPLKKFNRILDKGMEKEITQRYGAEYVDRLKRMTELNAGMAGKTREDQQVLSRYLSNIAAAKLTPVSALKQFSSVPLASSVIPFKYLAQASLDGLSKENISEMMELDPMVLRYRDNALGGIMPLNATNMEAERNIGTFKGKGLWNKIVKGGLNLSLEADKRALGIIYKATKLMAEAQGRGSDKAYIESKFMEAVRRTQNTTDLASATGWQEMSRKSSHWAFLNMYLNQTQKLPNEYIRLKRMITQAEKAHGKDSAQYKEAKGNMVNFIIGMGLMNAMTIGMGASASAILHKKDDKKTTKETVAELATDSLFNFVGNPILKPALGGSGYVLQKALPKSLGGKRQRTTNEAFGNDFSNLLPDATYTMSKMFEDLDGDEPTMRKLKKVTQDMLGSKSVESALAMGRVPTWYARYIYQLSNRFSDDSKTTKKSTGSTSLFKKRPQKKTRWKF